MPEIKRFHHLSLSVTDLAKSTQWYRETLGFEVTAEVEGDGFRRSRMRSGENGATLTLTCHDGGSGAAFSERRPGLDHVSLDVGSADGVRRLKQRFEELGVPHSEVKESPGGAMVTFRDPDNIQLEVFGESSGGR